MHDDLKEAIARIQRAAKENEKSSGIYSVSGDQAREFADQGFNMVSFLALCAFRNGQLISPDIGCYGYGRFADGYDCCSDIRKGFLCALRT